MSGINHDIVTDKEVLGEKASISHEQAMHFGELTEEERVIEKKLLRKIDSLIMPMVVLVYLMNYIDRYVCTVPFSRCPISSGTDVDL